MMPNSTQIQGAVRRVVAAVTGFVLSMVLLTALLITGFYLLIQSAIIALTPQVGEAAAMGLVGSSCILLLVAFFRRMTSGRSSTQSSNRENAGAASGIARLRELIRENPMESALMAFAFGFAQESDPRLKSLLLQGGMELMKRTSAEEGADQESQTSESEETSSQ